jgi:hypothetical protein
VSVIQFNTLLGAHLDYPITWQCNSLYSRSEYQVTSEANVRYRADGLKIKILNGRWALCFGENNQETSSDNQYTPAFTHCYACWYCSFNKITIHLVFSTTHFHFLGIQLLTETAVPQEPLTVIIFKSVWLEVKKKSNTDSKKITFIWEWQWSKCALHLQTFVILNTTVLLQRLHTLPWHSSPPCNLFTGLVGSKGSHNEDVGGRCTAVSVRCMVHPSYVSLCLSVGCEFCKEVSSTLRRRTAVTWKETRNQNRCYPGDKWQ